CQVGDDDAGEQQQGTGGEQNGGGVRGGLHGPARKYKWTDLSAPRGGFSEVLPAVDGAVSSAVSSGQTQVNFAVFGGLVGGGDGVVAVAAEGPDGAEFARIADGRAVVVVERDGGKVVRHERVERRRECAVMVLLIRADGEVGLGGGEAGLMVEGIGQHGLHVPCGHRQDQAADEVDRVKPVFGIVFGREVLVQIGGSESALVGVGQRNEASRIVGV